jgi:hypothetical protein
MKNLHKTLQSTVLAGCLSTKRALSNWWDEYNTFQSVPITAYWTFYQLRSDDLHQRLTGLSGCLSTKRTLDNWWDGHNMFQLVPLTTLEAIKVLSSDIWWPSHHEDILPCPAANMDIDMNYHFISIYLEMLSGCFCHRCISVVRTNLFSCLGVIYCSIGTSGTLPCLFQLGSLSVVTLISWA